MNCRGNGKKIPWNNDGLKGQPWGSPVRPSELCMVRPKACSFLLLWRGVAWLWAVASMCPTYGVVLCLPRRQTSTSCPLMQVRTMRLQGLAGPYPSRRQSRVFASLQLATAYGLFRSFFLILTLYHFCFYLTNIIRS